MFYTRDLGDMYYTRGQRDIYYTIVKWWDLLLLVCYVTTSPSKHRYSRLMFAAYRRLNYEGG